MRFEGFFDEDGCPLVAGPSHPLKDYDADTPQEVWEYHEFVLGLPVPQCRFAIAVFRDLLFHSDPSDSLSECACDWLDRELIEAYSDGRQIAFDYNPARED